MRRACTCPAHKTGTGRWMRAIAPVLDGAGAPEFHAPRACPHARNKVPALDTEGARNAGCVTHPQPHAR